MRRVIGIDLGTGNSCVAIADGDDVRVIADSEGHRTTPSIFSITNSQEHLVGRKALRQAEMNRLNTVFAIKRLIGRKFKSAEVQEFANRVPFKIVSALNGDAWVEVDDVPMSPEAISAHILTHMKRIAEENFGEGIHHAVITVPAHFNDSQRQATKDAGRIAGLHVMSIINEPTAAALAYGIDVAAEAAKNAPAEGDGKTRDRTIAVFDLGSGTFDITILALKNGTFEVLATGGDTYLGGEDFDLALVGHLLREFQKKEKVNLSQDRAVLQRLKEAARLAKQELSTKFSFEIVVPYICTGGDTGTPKDLSVTLERKTLENIANQLLNKLDAPCLQAMEDAKLKPDDIDDVILVGGMTRMPAVKQRCKKIFGKTPIDTVDPDEAVARGAAIQGALLQGALKGLKLADVTSLSLGLEVQGGRMVTLLPRNSKIPAKVGEVFTTSAPNQTEVSIHLLQGESAFVPENKSLGQFELTGISKAPRGVPRIEVVLEVDADGIVHLSAKDELTQEIKAIEIVNTSGLDDAEIKALANEARRESVYRAKKTPRGPSAAELELDRKELGKEFEELRNKLRTTVFETQFRLDSEGKRFKGARRAHLEEQLAIARNLLLSSQSEAELRESLTNVIEAVSHFENYLEAA